jgi:hypothetical protein
VPRPTLIDEGADGPCEICASWRALNQFRPAGKRLCEQCMGPLPVLPELEGHGYRSAAPHHFHIRPVGGVTGRECVWQELCFACFLATWRAAHPGLDYEAANAPPKPPPKLPCERCGHPDGEYASLDGRDAAGVPLRLCQDCFRPEFLAFHAAAAAASKRPEAGGAP